MKSRGKKARMPRFLASVAGRSVVLFMLRKTKGKRTSSVCMCVRVEAS